MREITIVYTDAQNSSLLRSNGMLLEKCCKLMDVENLTLETPKIKSILIRDLSLEINDRDHLLITGASGSGKTSLLRALAGLWRTGEGKITYYVEKAESPQLALPLDMPALAVSSEKSKGGRRARGIFFLPQRPYMVLGTLCQQLLYPTWNEDSDPTESTKFSDSLPSLCQAQNLQDSSGKPEKPTEDDLVQVLEDVRLGYVLTRFNGLDSTYEWSSALSLGEQQRLAFARLLLSKLNLVLLDESTSALDEANEAHLYKQIKAAGITCISVGHRRTLYDFHCRVLDILKMDADSDSDGSQRNWLLKPIDQDSTGGVANFVGLKEE